ncbi:type I-E CRISPR-associated protein Cas6/Cse3/CasE [Nonomuraea wenchangensis]|uniref:type I-E CRISPR-associated protein Cas6/Cse3/CasE n=1 Tax=Nonomuraea wenchangensis TaxID=568860 RepID=UPI0037BD9979
MFLTRFQFNIARSGALRLLSSPQRLHAAVMNAFADLPPRNSHDPRVLWRIDRNGGAETLLFIVSPVKPDLTHLAEEAGWPATERWQTYDYSPMLSRLVRGAVWGFRLTANPVHKIRRSADEPTKVTAHVGYRNQINWLLQRQEEAGFAVLEKSSKHRPHGEYIEYELVVRGQRRVEFAKAGQQRPVTLVYTTYDGLLKVTDVDALRRTLTSGLGRAKAYGCGLLTLSEI